MPDTIFTSLGQARYVGGKIRETGRQDITASTYTVAISTDPLNPPAAAAYSAAGMVSVVGTSSAERQVSVLVNAALVTAQALLPATIYCLWAEVVDRSEIEPIMLQRFVIG
jgi:hypothetical protein